jgi:ABC-type transport system substrate-binding protein
MIGTRILGPALAALLLAAGAALAQPATDEGAAPAPVPGRAATGAEKKPPTTAGPNSTPAKAGKSPSDYRASEEISEDLPVSFPVDI